MHNFAFFVICNSVLKIKIYKKKYLIAHLSVLFSYNLNHLIEISKSIMKKELRKNNAINFEK